MTYNITIPIKIGLFTFVAACLIVYFTSLLAYVHLHKPSKKMLLYVLFHIAIMVAGLLLTGFAKDL